MDRKKKTGTYISDLLRKLNGRKYSQTLSFEEWGLIEHYAELKKQGKNCVIESFKRPTISPENVRKNLKLDIEE